MRALIAVSMVVAASPAASFDSKAFFADVERLAEAHKGKKVEAWSADQYKSVLPATCGGAKLTETRPIAFPKGAPPTGIIAKYDAGARSYEISVEEQSAYGAANRQALQAAVQMNEQNYKTVGESWPARRFEPAPDTAGYVTFDKKLDSAQANVQARGHYGVMVRGTGVKSSKDVEACANAVKWGALQP